MAIALTATGSLSATAGGLTVTQQFMSGCFNAASNTRYQQYLAMDWSDGGQTVIFCDNSGGTSTDIVLTAYDGANNFTTVVAAGAVAIGTWIHLALAYNPGVNVQGWLNGVSLGTGTGSTTVTTQTVTDFAIGGGFLGEVQDVVFWNNATALPFGGDIKHLMRTRRLWNGPTG